MEEEVVAEEVACKEDQGGVDMLQQFVGTTRVRIASFVLLYIK